MEIHTFYTHVIIYDNCYAKQSLFQYDAYLLSIFCFIILSILSILSMKIQRKIIRIKNLIVEIRSTDDKLNRFWNIEFH